MMSGRRREVVSATSRKICIGGGSVAPGTAVVCGEVVAGKLKLRRWRVGEDVWEGDADGGSSMASSGGLL
jgi:hypothetical protein